MPSYGYLSRGTYQKRYEDISSAETHPARRAVWVDDPHSIVVHEDAQRCMHSSSKDSASLRTCHIIW